MKNRTLILLTSLCLFGCAENNQTDPENNQTELLLAKVDSLKIENDSLTKLLTEEKPVSQSNYWYNAEYDGRKLIKSGIENPAEFIENKLRERPELIPLKPVLGGTIHFTNMQLLGREWIIAEYEDGHIQGRAIYKYELNDQGELEFELLNSMEP